MTRRRSGVVLAATSSFFFACSQASDGPTQPLVIGDTTPPTRLVVSVSTTGYVSAGDFTFTVDEAETREIGANGSVSVEGLPAGPHDVLLNVGAYCRAPDAVQRVLVGEASTVHFDVECVGWGTLKVYTESLGALPVASHWLEFEVGDVGAPLVANAATVVPLVAREYWLQFHPAPNCTTSTPGQVVDVEPGTVTTLLFRATCEPAGSLRAYLILTGDDLPSSISWNVVPVGGGAVDSLTLWPGYRVETTLAPGSWIGQLGALPDNCQAVRPGPEEFSIEEGGVTDIRVSVSCVRYRGWLRASLEATGPYGAFGLSIDGSCTAAWELFADFCAMLQPNGSILVDMSPGSYGVHVTPFTSDAVTCSVSPEDPITAVVQSRTITDVAFSVDCD